MELKKRTMPKKLQIFNVLAPRIELSTKDKQTYYSLQKGYEGELMFDHILDNQLQCEHLIIKDLVLTFESNTFQIDTLIIFPTNIELFEVKNFEGEFFYDQQNNKLYKNSDFEVQNPEHQMSRAETLLRRLLIQLGLKVNLRGSVIFVNPEFTLYHHTPDKPFILPTQINPLIRKFNENSSNKITNRHIEIGNNLVSLHDSDYPVKGIPNYTFEELKKGINCHQCNSLSIYISGHYCYCTKCGSKEKVKNAIIRSTEDFKLLFPKEKITTAKIYRWCGSMISVQRVNRTLAQHYTLLNRKRWSYYEPKAVSN